MIITVATLDTVMDLVRQGQEIIKKFNAAKGQEAQLAVAGEAITFAKEARLKLTEEIDGAPITAEAAREAIANIARGEADYLAEFDNTRKPHTPTT